MSSCCFVGQDLHGCHGFGHGLHGFLFLICLAAGCRWVCTLQ
ncbi:hypothetical protein [Azospirillum palustre]